MWQTTLSLFFPVDPKPIHTHPNPWNITTWPAAIHTHGRQHRDKRSRCPSSHTVVVYETTTSLTLAPPKSKMIWNLCMIYRSNYLCHSLIFLWWKSEIPLIVDAQILLRGKIMGLNISKGISRALIPRWSRFSACTFLSVHYSSCIVDRWTRTDEPVK